MPIHFGEIRINQESRRHILDCLDRNQVTMGTKVAQLEQQWSQLFDHKYTVAINSGTSACTALIMSLYDWGAEPGDEVIVPGLSFIATANAVRAAGLTPVFVDVKVHTLNIDVDLIEASLTPRTRAIICVNLMGKPADLDVLAELTRRRHLKLFGDCCESHGCTYHGRYPEHYCDATAYSCYAAHILFGVELGLVCTNDDMIRDVVQSVRSHGRKPYSHYFEHQRYGLNMKPTDLHAAVALGNLTTFWETFDKRYENLVYLKAELGDLRENFYFSEEEPGCNNSPHAFSLTIKPGSKVQIKQVKLALDQAEIEWKRNFGSMAHHGAFRYLGYGADTLPNSRYCGENGIHVGCHQFLSTEDLNQIADTLRRFV